MLQYTFDFLSEIFLICIYPVSGILVNFVPRSHFESKKNGKTILIVERWLTFNIRHLYWKYYLEKKGFRVIIKNFSLLDGDFEKSSLKLGKYLEESNYKNVVLVGISGGALTSLLYLQEHNGWKRVNRFIAIGAPFRGTWSAFPVAFTYSGRELFPTSPLIQRITAMKLIHLERIICIKAKYDEMVPKGAVLPGTNSIALPIFGHNNLHLRIRATYKKISDFAKDQRIQD